VDATIDIHFMFSYPNLSADEGFRLLLRLNRGNLSRSYPCVSARWSKRPAHLPTDGSVVTSMSLKIISSRYRTWPGASISRKFELYLRPACAQFHFVVPNRVLDYGRSLQDPRTGSKLSSGVIQKIREFLNTPGIFEHPKKHANLISEIQIEAALPSISSLLLRSFGEQLGLRRCLGVVANTRLYLQASQWGSSCLLHFGMHRTGSRSLAHFDSFTQLPCSMVARTGLPITFHAAGLRCLLDGSR
jgi:hypothetical protein